MVRSVLLALADCQHLSAVQAVTGGRAQATSASPTRCSFAAAAPGTWMWWITSQIQSCIPAGRPTPCKQQRTRTSSTSAPCLRPSSATIKRTWDPFEGCWTRRTQCSRRELSCTSMKITGTAPQTCTMRLRKLKKWCRITPVCKPCKCRPLI